jgi:hypothetical protein
MHALLVLVYIHNRAFIQALRENPTGPYYTSRAISYLSAYRYASEIIRANIDNFKHHPQLFSRWWPTWKTCMSWFYSTWFATEHPLRSIQRRSSSSFPVFGLIFPNLTTNEKDDRWRRCSQVSPGHIRTAGAPGTVCRRRTI